MSDTLHIESARDIGDLLLKAREERGWSQRQASKEWDLNPGSLRAYELGDRMPSLPTLTRLLKELGITATIGEQPQWEEES